MRIEKHPNQVDVYQTNIINHMVRMELMKPQKGTKAYKAYAAGVAAFEKGLDETANPFTTRATIAFSNWWLTGFRERQETPE